MIEQPEKKTRSPKRRKTDVDIRTVNERKATIRANHRNLSKLIIEGCNDAWEDRGITITRWKSRK